MAKVVKRVDTRLSADELWGIVGDPAQVGWAGGDATFEDGVRTAPVPGGALMRERIHSVDPESRRYEYSIIESPLELEHHAGSIEVIPNGDQSSLVWTMEFRPDVHEETFNNVLDNVLAPFREEYGV